MCGLRFTLKQKQRDARKYQHNEKYDEHTAKRTCFKCNYSTNQCKAGYEMRQLQNPEGREQPRIPNRHPKQKSEWDRHNRKNLD
jgi:hypothetical protein